MTKLCKNIRLKIITLYQDYSNLFKKEIGFSKKGKFIYGVLAKNTIIGDMEYNAGHYIYFLENGQLSDTTEKIGITQENKIINGILYPKGTYLEFERIKKSNYENNSGSNSNNNSLKLKQAKIIIPTTLNGISLPAKSVVNFNYDNTTNPNEYNKYSIDVSTPYNLKINGITYSKKGYLYYYKSGKLKSATLKDNTVINSFELQEGTDVYFYENGQLNSGRATKEFIRNGVTFDNNSYFKLYEDGSFKSGRPNKNSIIKDMDNLKILPRKVEFYPDGNLKSATPANENLLMNGVRLAEGEVVNFHPNKRLKSARIAEDTRINGLLFLKFDSETYEDVDDDANEGVLSFYDNGALMSGFLKNDSVTNDGIKIEGQRNVTFFTDGGFKSGVILEVVSVRDRDNFINFCTGMTVLYSKDRVRSCKLKEDKVIEGQNFLKGTFVKFDGKGKLIPISNEEKLDYVYHDYSNYNNHDD
ncbi:MAG: hypothetical protein HQK49_08145 [Oligoflexia bacterium]|nr:hypothetical protein [Oligoflexia bacterium]